LLFAIELAQQKNGIGIAIWIGFSKTRDCDSDPDSNRGSDV